MHVVVCCFFGWFVVVSCFGVVVVVVFWGGSFSFFLFCFLFFGVGWHTDFWCSVLFCLCSGVNRVVWTPTKVGESM